MSITTLNQIVDHCLRRHPRDDALSYKEDGSFRNISTREFARRVTLLGLGLADLDVGIRERTAIISENRPEWAIADMSILSIGGVCVPIYDSLTPAQTLYIMRDAGVKTVIISNGDQLAKVRSISEELMDDLTIVLVEGDLGRESGVYTLDEIYSRGESMSRRDPSLFTQLSGGVRPDDVATIVYTSGTTGPPRGAMLTHQNILSNVEAVLAMIPVDHRDTVLSFLPLSHILERMAGYYAILAAGGAIAYAGGVETIAEDMMAVSPTFLIAVPRFFEKLQDRIQRTVQDSSAAGKRMFAWAVDTGLLNEGNKPRGRKRTCVESLRLSIARNLVFSRIRETLGGRIRFFVSGGAPLPLEIARFFRAIEIPIYEGYGLTETSPVVTCNAPGAWRHGSVGRAAPGVEIKIAPDGEIAVRGPNVMSGYLGREKETNDAMKQGWFFTGDIGEIDKDGFLYILDRKKDLIVTSGGRNIAPQPIETALRRSPCIKEIVLIGNGRKFVSALIVPDLDSMDIVAEPGSSEKEEMKVVIDDSRIRDIIEKEIEERSGGLASYEKIIAFTLLGSDFSIEEELTPTLKVRRRVVEQKYRCLIDEMYR